MKNQMTSGQKQMWSVHKLGLLTGHWVSDSSGSPFSSAERFSICFVFATFGSEAL